jgi:hypothetical protein
MISLTNVCGISSSGNNMNQLKPVYAQEKKINIHENHKVCPDFCTILYIPADYVSIILRIIP